MANEQVNKTLEANKEASEKSRKEAQERLKGKPTPTQEENDRAKLGEHITEHEDDGSGPEPHADQNAESRRRQTGEAKTSEASRPGAGYQTRQTKPAS
jgi:hypothetical protein